MCILYRYFVQYLSSGKFPSKSKYNAHHTYYSNNDNYTIQVENKSFFNENTFCCTWNLHCLRRQTVCCLYNMVDRYFFVYKHTFSFQNMLIWHVDITRLITHLYTSQGTIKSIDLNPTYIYLLQCIYFVVCKWWLLVFACFSFIYYYYFLKLL